MFDKPLLLHDNLEHGTAQEQLTGVEVIGFVHPFFRANHQSIVSLLYKSTVKPLI